MKRNLRRITLILSEDLENEILQASANIGINKSSFARAAIYEKLEKMKKLKNSKHKAA